MLTLTHRTGFNLRQNLPRVRRGVGTAGLLLGAEGAGAMHRVGTGTAGFVFSADGSGTLLSPVSGVGTATVTMGADGIGSRHATGAGSAALVLGATGAGTAISQPTGLISMWRMDAYAGGAFADSFGGYPLVSAVTAFEIQAAAGLIGGAGECLLGEDENDPGPPGGYHLIASGGMEDLTEGSLVFWCKSGNTYGAGESVAVNATIRPAPYPVIGDLVASFGWENGGNGTGWHLIAFRWNETESQLFIDGASSGSPGSALTGLIFGTLEFQFGGSAVHDATYIRLEEVSIWSRPLSNAEIAWLYNSGAGRSLPYTF